MHLISPAAVRREPKDLLSPQKKNIGMMKSINSGAVFGSVLVPDMSVEKFPKSCPSHHTAKRKIIAQHALVRFGLRMSHNPNITGSTIRIQFEGTECAESSLDNAFGVLLMKDTGSDEAPWKRDCVPSEVQKVLCSCKRAKTIKIIPAILATDLELIF